MKKKELRIKHYLEHILEAIERIYTYTENTTENVFLTDTKTQDAVVRNFEIIGEACNNIASSYPEFANQHKHVPWKITYEMRNALSHGYFKVDFEIVWQTIEKDLPLLEKDIRELIDNKVQ